MIATSYNYSKPGPGLTLLVSLIVLLVVVVALQGILSDAGSGTYIYESIRGEQVEIYGRGIYQHMSAEVAIQGITQDYLSLCVAVPLLLLAFYRTLKGSLQGRFVLAGTLGYFFVTYLFYTVMAMYNAYFLAYVALMGCSFFALAATMRGLNLQNLASGFSANAPVRLCGGFLILNSILISLLWLSVVVPPLADSTIYPKSVEHYTTLIVQGLDLGLLLPLSFVSGLYLMRRKALGFLMAPVYLIFLSLLMAALVCKIAYMGTLGYAVIPAVFVVPAMALASVVCSYLLIRSIRPLKSAQQP